MIQLLCAAMLFLQPSLGHEKAHQYATWFVEAGELEGVDPFLLAGLGHYESHWNPEAESHAGACGLMQIIGYAPNSWRRRQPPCEKLKKDIWLNIRLAAKELADYEKNYPGSWKTALCRYNRGPESACTPSKTVSFTTGVIWTRDLLVNYAAREPVADICCSVKIPIEEYVAEYDDCFPIYSKAMPKHGRRFVRERRARAEKQTKRSVLRRACEIAANRGIEKERCLHGRGKVYDCEISERGHAPK